jgi:OOP family OmpA-OmpF porin
MKHGLKVVGLLCAMFATGTVWAQDDTQASDIAHALSGRPWYVSGMFSYVDADSDRGTKGGLGGIVSIGKKVTWGLTLELSGYYASADAKHGGGSADLYGYGASALFFPSQTFPNAYGIVSLMQGRTESLPGPRDDFDSTVFDVGLGYLQPITAHILLRAEARYRTDDKGGKPTGPKGKTNNFAEGVYSVGLMFPFGGVAVKPGTPEEAATAVVDTESADDDNDGVSNDNDQCPGSPAGAVDDSGCPASDSGAADDSAASGADAAAPVSDDSASTDSSGDAAGDTSSAAGAGDAGNTDCRTPQAGEQVDENGCAVDAATPAP